MPSEVRSAVDMAGGGLFSHHAAAVLYESNALRIIAQDSPSAFSTSGVLSPLARTKWPPRQPRAGLYRQPSAANASLTPGRASRRQETLRHSVPIAALTRAVLTAPGNPGRPSAV